MVTQIQLGNMFNSGGKTVMSGGNSGIDVEGMIKSLSEAKRQPAVILEGKVETNTKRSEAISEMKQLLTDFKDAANFLRSPPGVQNEADNIFEYRTANVTSNSTVAGSTYLNITAEPGAPVANYTIEVTQLATRNIKTTATFALTNADTSAVGGGGPFNAGTLTLGASGKTIVLEAGDTLNQVAAKINSIKDQSHVEATVIRISDGNYRLSLKTTETGADLNYDIHTPNAGLFNVGFAIEQDALNAQITLDGTLVERQSNSVSDLVDGMTFNLLAKTPPGTELEVAIDADRNLAKQAIVNFIDTFNAFRLFASRQTEIGTDGLPTEDAVLANNRALTSTLSRMIQEMGQVVEGITGSDPSRLADLGITFSDFPGDEETPFTRNILTLDEDKLDAALESNFDGVRRVFEFDMISDNPNLSVFSRTNALNASNFTLNINQTTGTYTATYDDNGTPRTIALEKSSAGTDAILLKGMKGTVLEGLTLIYADTDNTTIEVNISQGLGDRLYNALDDALDEDTGIVTTTLNQIEEESSRYNDEISRIDEQIEKFRQTLLDKFSALETVISQANTLLQSLDAQSRARESA